MATLMRESRVVNSRRGSLAVAQTDQYLPTLGRLHLDDLEAMMVGVFVYRTSKRK